MNHSNETEKSFWTRENALVVAERFGYILNPDFINALGELEKIAMEADTLTWMSSIATGMFRAYIPPLERIHSVSPGEPPLQNDSKPPNTPVLPFISLGPRVLTGLFSMLTTPKPRKG